MSKKIRICIVIFSAWLVLMGGITIVAFSHGVFSNKKVETILVDDSSQSVYVEDAEMPDIVIKGSSFKIRGIIKTNQCSIVNVYGSIETIDENVVQFKEINEESKIHNLKTTINNSLIFGELDVGEYIYKVVVTVKNGDSTSIKTLVQCKFKVVEE